VIVYYKLKPYRIKDSDYFKLENQPTNPFHSLNLMSDVTNLTNRITHLRDRKNKAGIGPEGTRKTPLKGKKTTRERRFATDFFMLIAYSLLGAAILSQCFLIVWLDIF